MNTILSNISLRKLKLKDISKKYLSWLNDTNNQRYLELKKKITLNNLKEYLRDKDKEIIWYFLY